MNDEIIFDSVKGTFIGIDLGTSNSVVSFFKEGQFDQIKFSGQKIIPSVLYFEDEEKIIFGKRALKKGFVNPEYMLKEFKTHLGKNKKYEFEFTKESSETKKEITSYYVIDTNVFINEPLVMELFNKNATDVVVLPEKVIDELSYREEQSETEQPSKMAMESIEETKKSKEIELIFEESHLEILGEDLEKDSKNSINDNKILSIAKYYKDILSKDIYLVTNDKGLKIKAELDENSIKTFTLEQLREEKIKEKDNSQNKRFTITPKEASKKLLQHLKEESEKYLGEIIEKAVITVPANFNQGQIGQVKEAGEEAGFIEIRIQKEPVAVGFAYALEDEKEKNILVYDFGGGTFDASLLRVGGGEIQVVNTDGDPNLGGKDITDKVTELIYDRVLDETKDMLDMFEEENGLSRKDYIRNKNIIYQEAERVKIELSELENATVSLINLIMPSGENQTLEFELSRKDFETEISEIRKKSLDIVKNLIIKSELDKSEIDEIVMAGGSARIPSIADSIKDTFGIEVKSSIDSSVVISQGALIEGVKEWEEETTIQKKIVYNDTALADFGVGLKEHNFDLLIASGEDLPFQVTKDYMTNKDYQEKLDIEVYERRSSYPDARKTFDKGINFIGRIEVTEIPPRIVGELLVQVTFELTKDDTLETSVKIVDKDRNVIDEKKLKISEASNG